MNARFTTLPARDGGYFSGKALFAVVALVQLAVAGGAIVKSELALRTGESFRFRAMAWDGYGNKMYNPAVTWTVTAGSVGTINASGVFTASASAGTYADVIVVGNGVLTDTASVTVFWPQRVCLPLVLKDD